MRTRVARIGMVAVLALSFHISGRAAHAGPAEDGKAAYNRGDFATALQLLRPLAEQGDASAQNDLGWMYSHGNGVEQDLKEAVRLYQLAAKQGNTSAQFNLGVMYFEGSGTPQDSKEAVKWYRAAATHGEPNAQYNLGFMYVNGKGVAKDLLRGHMWWNIASGEGSAVAWASLQAISKTMTPQQVAQAEAMARKCKESGYKECG